jgi:hypothetical protein
MAAFRFELPDIDDPFGLADWVEVMMLLRKPPHISRAQLIEAFAASVGATSQELEAPVNFLFAEIGRRRRIADRGYPLIVDGALVKLDPTANFEFYKFLLLVSLDGPMRRGKKFKDIDEIYDNVVGAAARGYLGEGAKMLRFGWPPSGGRPSNFTAALEWLSTSIGVPLGSSVSSAATKDGGVDVVAWKPFGDNFTAFMVAFIQCTVQSNWLPKGRDVIERIWFSRIDNGGWALTGLAIPFVIPKNFDKGDDLRRTVHLVFDRLRLTQMLRDCDVGPFAQMIKWSSKEIARYALAV